jgi:pimeloyl-ACP methyl ester carboxylesterase
MKLNFKTYGNGPALIILHGLFGSLDNWVSHAHALENEYSVYLLDQRNHGKSPHNEVFTYTSMAEDLHEFMNDEGISYAHLLGHSMGGKTVMEFAGLYPERIEKLIVADMGVKKYRPHHEDVLKAISGLDLPSLQTRKEAEAFLMENLNNDKAVVQFLLKGLAREIKGDFKWKFNYPTILAHYDNILQGVTLEPFEKPTLFLSGGNSKYVLPEDHAQILQFFPHAEFEVMPNVGHWLHAENPTLFLEYVQAFLAK